MADGARSSGTLKTGLVPAQSMKKETVVSTARMIAATVTHGTRLPGAGPEAVVSVVLICSTVEGVMGGSFVSGRRGAVSDPTPLPCAQRCRRPAGLCRG